MPMNDFLIMLIILGFFSLFMYLVYLAATMSLVKKKVAKEKKKE